MPWSPKSAKRHTRRANTAKKRRQWSHVSNAMLKRTGDEGAAIRAANAVVAKRKKSKRRKRGSSKR